MIKVRFSSIRFQRLIPVLIILIVAIGMVGHVEQTAQAQTAPKTVHVNQLGYLPGFNKLAMAVNSSTTPVTWQLLNSSGTVVASGQTTVYGHDNASGDNVHIIDFSFYTTQGTNYTLNVAGQTSYPFSISTTIYHNLKYSNLNYYYNTRSGIAITTPYDPGSQWNRPAGHIQVSPNQGDKSVTCLNSACSYSLDVSGGWYDAGDQGKYVVNGGIATWTLQDLYERTQYKGTSLADFGDGKMNIPESGNGFPDLLDEARWEMTFLMEMQVPSGQTNAGMAFHKVHDDAWTGLPTMPDQDSQPRHLHPPSTAATLNLAATAAQCARIWKTLDATFSNKCLTAAQNAWTAAQANPSVLAPSSDSTGGGAYDDTNVQDDFYWAAAELYITTGSSTYLNYLTSSPLYKQFPTSFGTDGNTSMTWGSTQNLGNISLAIVPNNLNATDLATIRSNLVAAADSYINSINTQGYRLPFSGGSSGVTNSYPWGSNSFVANNGVVLALAYDLTGNAKYLNGAAEAMNYLLGRNGLSRSYIVGYGSNAVQNLHSRWWANELNSSLPHPPPGTVAGGPNSGLQDPTASANLSGCAPMKCHIDDIQSYSTNEEAINWNAPVAWLAAFLDEKSTVSTVTGAPTSTPAPTNTTVPTVAPTNTISGAPTVTVAPSKTNTPVPTTAPSNTPVPTSVITNTPAATPGSCGTATSPTNGLNVLIDKGNGVDNTQETGFNWLVKNTGSSAISNISVRIYFNTDGSNAASGYVLEKYYDQSGVGTISGPTLASGSTNYFTVSYGSASLAAGAQWEFQTALHLSSWASTYDGSNDWYHTGYAVGALPASYTNTNYIPGYINGTLSWGSLPVSATATPCASGPTATFTFIPPSNTPLPSATPIAPTKTNTPVATAVPSNTPIPPTKTNTPVPSNTPVATAVPSATPIPPSNTPVPTIAPSNTPIPTTAPSNTPVPTTVTCSTPTSAPASSGLTIQIDKGNGVDNTQETGFNYLVKNTGTSAVSNISVRVYFTTDGSNAGSSYVFEKYYDQSGVGSISGPTLASGSTYYFTVSYGSASLAAGAQWEFQTALHLSSWASTYDGSNDWYHTGYAVGALPASYTNTNYIPGYVNGTLTWGSVPGGSTGSTATPSCGGGTPAPTATTGPTKTNTPVPTSGPTATTGATSVATATKTNTPVPTSGPTATPCSGCHLSNPFAGATWFVNPAWQSEVSNSKITSSQKSDLSGVNTAVWLDTMAAVNGTGGYPYSVTGWLDQAESQGANLIIFVIYDLPNRDCAAIASNGEIPAGMSNLTGIYEPSYIDPIASAFSQSKYSNLRIVTVIEPDSLPNVVTNNGNLRCTNDYASVYETGIEYAINKFHAINNVYTYMDIGQYAWLGWSSNLGWDITTPVTGISTTGTTAVQLYASVIKATTAGVNSIDGFISNTANYSPVQEPFMSAYQQVGGNPVRSYANFYQWNQFIDDSSYSLAFQTAERQLGIPAANSNMLIDTSRNGWGGCGGLIASNTNPCRPTAASTSTTLATFVDSSRIDRRPYGGAWCNQNGAGLGPRPQANPSAITIANSGTTLASTFSYAAYVWIKPPGESDGADGTGLPTPTPTSSGTGKGYDSMCMPGYVESGGGNPLGLKTNALSGAPTAGMWNENQFDQLVSNAYPALP